MGPLGDYLGDTVRSLVMACFDVRAHAAGEIVIEYGAPLHGVHLVGGGSIKLVSPDDDTVTDELLPGAFLFPAQILVHEAAPMRARAGAGGALVLVCDEKMADELFATVPSLIEILR